MFQKTQFFSKKALIFMIPVLTFALFAALFIAYKLINRNGIIYHSKTDISPKNVVYYCQFDERWADDNLGTSKYKMRDSGCLVSCIAAAEKMQGIANTDPGKLNKEFSEHLVYDGEGNLQWEEFENSIISVTRKDASEVTAKALDTLLLNGVYPIARVKLSYGVGHYVLIVGSENGEYLCMDPLKEKQEPVPLSEFGDKIYFFRYFEK